MAFELSMNARSIRTFDKIYVQDFGDDYHRNLEGEDNLLKRAKTILTIYHNITDYDEAVDIYEEYIDILQQKYGGEELFDIYRNSGEVTDFIPPKPKLKKSNYNIKMFIKYGIKDADSFEKMPSVVLKERMEKNLQFIFDEFNDTHDEMEIEIPPVLYEEKATDIELTMMLNALIQKESGVINSSANSFDMMEAYFMRSKKGNANMEEVEYKRPTLTDLQDPYYDPSEWDIPVSSDSRDYVDVNGRLITTNQYKDYQMSSSLKEAGWDPLMVAQAFSTGDDNDALNKLFKDDIKLTKKEKKRLKKQSKKVNQVAQDEALSVLQNEFGISVDSYAEYEQAMLNASVPDFFSGF